MEKNGVNKKIVFAIIGAVVIAVLILLGSCLLGSDDAAEAVDDNIEIVIEPIEEIVKDEAGMAEPEEDGVQDDPQKETVSEEDGKENDTDLEVSDTNTSKENEKASDVPHKKDTNVSVTENEQNITIVTKAAESMENDSNSEEEKSGGDSETDENISPVPESTKDDITVTEDGTIEFPFVPIR